MACGSSCALMKSIAVFSMIWAQRLTGKWNIPVLIAGKAMLFKGYLWAIRRLFRVALASFLSSSPSP